MTHYNDYAFPKDCDQQSGGLTIREHFAAMAMQGLLSQHIKHKKDEVEDCGYQSEPVYKAQYISTLEEENDYLELARDAVAIADALIKELNKET